MANVAIMGYGTVGAGVCEVLRANAADIASRAGQPVTVTRVLDVRDFPGDPVEPLLTRRFEDILEDDSIVAAAETMGGLEPAYAHTKALLARGKSVVTSNKELVATHGPELIRLSAENKCRFLFEASVCGGIPLIRTITNALTADRITAISGILNGTTNFILTKMAAGADYDGALAEARHLGYVERNPDADILGWDARRKIAILASLAAERHVPDSEIPTEGIQHISHVDMAYARHLGMTVKLLGVARVEPGGVAVCVAPFLVPRADLFGAVGDVYNAVRITGNCLGDVALYGRGAGGVATGSAVVGNLVDAVRGPKAKSPRTWPETRATVTDAGRGAMRRLVRVGCDSRPDIESAIRAALEGAEIVGAEVTENEFAFLTPVLTEDALNERLGAMRGHVTGILRVYE